MTVKLAKLFSNSATNNSSSSQQQQQPPPLPPPNPPQAYNYYNQQLPHLQAKAQKPYNPYMMDDEDDNMSLYSTTASIMTSRDHPFNNSQRPLLAERKPQVVVKQNGNNSNKKKQQQHNASQKQQHQEHHQQQQQKSYISPYVQQQKRDSAKGLHGFNDFDILSQQYNQHLQSSPHIGYPYGSPPSPTQTSSDFVFDTSATTISKHPASMTRGDNSGSSSMERHKHHQQQQQQKFASISTALTSTPRYGNISNYGSTSGVSTNNYYNSSTTTGGISGTSLSLSRGPATTSPYYDVNEADYYGKSSRFEDDFCNRRNIEFAKCHTLDTPSSTATTANGSHLLHEGPFIFGIAPEHQTDFTRMPAGGRSFGDISEDSGITKDDDKYSTKGRFNTFINEQPNERARQGVSSSLHFGIGGSIMIATMTF
ncbi:ras-interacting protein RIP3-like, partial [Musca vetustissima]|uniref:ras-interacting protein RIP3-like n=1 Tax=Musca vetustissima TaxID=27455 RepID=UPI002AB6A63A